MCQGPGWSFKKVIHLVVAPDQTCGVKGRYIGENVALLRDVVEYTKETGCHAAILALDQEKAFDRVDWDFLFAVLARLGFGPGFIQWVRVLYTDVASAVLVNGYTSDRFKPSRGVRQGCPLSPLLYVLSMEVLAANIRANPFIVGLSLPRVPRPLPVLSLYADDTSVIVTSDFAILSVFEVYDDFQLGSGAKLNMEKCEGLWLGGWRGRLDAPVSIQWTDSKIKALGVFIGNCDVEEANWLPRIEAVRQVLSFWRHRVLSFQGKVLVVNALALSRVWNVGALVGMPSWVRLQLDKLIFSFLWGGKPDKVARNIVVHPRSRGGLSMISIEAKMYALLVQWVKQFRCSSSGWVSLLTYWCFDRFGVDPYVVFANPFYFSPDVFPVFYRSLFYAWRFLGGVALTSGLAVGSFFPSGPMLVESISSRAV